MHLKRSSLFVKWAYLLKVLAGDYIPRQTSACVLFWRAFLLTPIVVLAALVVSPIVATAFALYVVVRGAAVGVLYLIPNETPRLDAVGEAVGSAFSVVGGFIGSLYHKACPIVHIDG